MGILDIIANPTPLKIPDPNAGYGDMLQNVLAMEKITDSRRTRRDTERMNEALKPYYSAKGLDLGGARNALAQAGMANHIPGIEENESKRLKLDAETLNQKSNASMHDATSRKLAVETRDKAIAMIPMILKGANTIDDVRTNLNRTAADPMFVQALGGVEPAKAFYQGLASEAQGAERMGTFPQWLYQYQTDAKTATERKVDSRDLGGKMVTSSYNVSGPNAGKLRTETTETITESPKAPRTVINNNMPGHESVSEFDKVVGKGQGESFLKLQEAALGAPARVRDIDRTINIIDSGKLFIGTGAEPKLDAIRVADMLGVPVDKDLIRNTEEVIAGLVQNTLTGIARFEQMGVRLTPMSDKDLQMFRDASPQIKNSPEMVKRLLRVERQLYQDSIKMFNQRRNEVTSNPRTSPTIKAMSIGGLPEIPDVVSRAAPKWRDGMTGVNGKKINQKQFNELLSDRDNPKDIALFDEFFGAGSAARILGGAPTGDRPLPR